MSVHYGMNRYLVPTSSLTIVSSFTESPLGGNRRTRRKPTLRTQTVSRAHVGTSDPELVRCEVATLLTACSLVQQNSIYMQIALGDVTLHYSGQLVNVQKISYKI